MKKFQVRYGNYGDEGDNVDIVIAYKASVIEGVLIFEDEKSEPVAIYRDGIWSKVSQITK